MESEVNVAWLWQWIKRRFRHRRQRSGKKSPTVIRRYYSEKCVVFELARHTPSATATYRIVARDKQYQLLITLDSLREIEGEMVGKFDGEFIYLRSRIKPPSLSHRFAIWKIEAKTSCLGCWDINLEGAGNGGILAPSRIARSFACYFLKHDFSESFDWLNLLQQIAREYLPCHNLLALKREVYYQKIPPSKNLHT